MGLDSTALDDNLLEVDDSAQVSHFIRTFFPNNSGAINSSAHVEIEYKYFPSNSDVVIEKLGQSAEKVQGRTLMRAFKFGPHNNQPIIPQCIDIVRLRDEGDGVKVAIKKSTNHHAVEQEFDASEELNDLLQRFTDKGMIPYQEMEKYRTTWRFGTCTIVLDECPGLEPFFEIEGPTEEAIEKTWNELGGEKVWGEKKKLSGTDLYRKRFGPDIFIEQRQVTFSNPKFSG